jgi:type II secretory pathway component PulJ
MAPPSGGSLLVQIRTATRCVVSHRLHAENGLWRRLVYFLRGQMESGANLSKIEKRRQGKALREKCPRTSLAEWKRRSKSQDLQSCSKGPMFDCSTKPNEDVGWSLSFRQKEGSRSQRASHRGPAVLKLHGSIFLCLVFLTGTFLTIARQTV